MTQKNESKAPRGWAPATIDLVVSADGVFCDGDWVETKDQDPDGDVRLIQLADIGDGEFLDKSARFLTKTKARELNCTFLAEGDLLIARMPDPLGRACIFPLSGTERFVTVVDVCIVRIDPKYANTKYLMHVINSPTLRSQIEAFKSGSTRKRISRGNLARVQFPVSPRTEQDRIVAKIEELLSELDNGIEDLKTAKAQLLVYRQAVLKHAFEGKLTARWRKQNKDKLASPDHLLKRIQRARGVDHLPQMDEHQTAVTNAENHRQSKEAEKPTPRIGALAITPDELAKLPMLPAEWTYVRLSEIAEIGSGMSVSKSRLLIDPITVPYLRVANVQRGHLDLSNITTMEIERDQLSRLKLKKWDVLFNEGGDRDKLGRGWIWESQIEPCITQNHVFRASPYLPSMMHAKFISYWGNTFGQNYFLDEGKQTTNLASINKGVLSNFPVPLASLEEQEEIVTEIDEKLTMSKQLELEVTTALERLLILKSAILDNAFSGKLVEQDRKDEPASALLERIRGDKAETANDNKKIRRRDAA